MTSLKQAGIGILLLFLVCLLQAQTPDWIWAEPLGGSYSDEVSQIAADSAGNSYITGSYIGDITVGNLTLPNRSTNLTTHDVFVAKYDTEGNVLWASRAGGNNTEYGNGIAVDPFGNVYVIGVYNSSILYFGETDTLSLARNGTSNDIFIAKLDANGAWLWAKRAGYRNSDVGSGIAVDANSNAYVCGTFTGGALFPPLTEGILGVGNLDVFVGKMNPDGDFIWVTKVCGTNSETAQRIALDAGGNAYVCGAFASDSILFGDPALGDTLLLYNTELNSSFDSYVAKLDTDGNWLWAQKSVGVGNEFANDVAVDLANNIYITGKNDSEVVFGTLDPLFTHGNFDVFVVKYDSLGNALWASDSGGASYDVGWGIATEAERVYLTGEFKSTADFGAYTLTSTTSSSSDAFLVTLDPSDGQITLAQSAGGNYIDIGKSVATNGDGSSLWTGTFTGSVLLPSDISLTGHGSNNKDIYIAKQLYPQPMATLSQVVIDDGTATSLYANQQCMIHWTASGVTDICLDYSTDAGNTWQAINLTPIPAGQSMYPWIVPQVTCDFALLRVRSLDSSVSAVSDTFSIYEPLRLTSLTGGEILFNTDSASIIWTVHDVNATPWVYLFFSIDSGQTWTLIENDPIPAGQGTQAGGYLWDLPDINCVTIRVRIEDSINSMFYAVSSSDFSILQSITLQSFTGGASYPAASQQEIQWSLHDTDLTLVALEYTLDNGSYWYTIADSLDPSLQTHPWLLPDTLSFSARVRMKDSVTGYVLASSSQNFAIIYPPAAPLQLAACVSPATPDDILVNWSAVETDIQGNPLSPSGYRIYCSLTPDAELADMALVSTVSNGTSYLHQGAALTFERLYYRVVAFCD